MEGAETISANNTSWFRNNNIYKGLLNELINILIATSRKDHSASSKFANPIWFPTNFIHIKFSACEI